ncbi:MAG: alanine racemase [Bacillota bacterium]|nr:alanine racemase [Bacillota bacterium]
MGGKAGQKWIEIDLDAIEHNLQSVQAKLTDQVTLIAVIKADAYGHGAVESARVLEQAGVRFFAVSFGEEAFALRQGGIQSPILVFSPVIDKESLIEAIELEIRLTIASEYDWQCFKQVEQGLSKTPYFHLKLDTGLGRFGLQTNEAYALLQDMTVDRQVIVEGVYTHMAHAASSPAYTEKQYTHFLQFIEQLDRQGIQIPLKHCANSAVVLKYPHMYLDAVRVGTLLSGQQPVGHFSEQLSLKDPYAFKCKIISLKSLPKGSFLGYYRTYRLKKEAKIAVIPVGFYDGLVLEVGNRPSGFIDMLKMMARIFLGYLNVSRFTPQVTYKGKNYPIRGKVFMQLALVEFPADLPVEVGEELALPVRKTLAAHEIERVYVRNGKQIQMNQVKEQG